MRTTEVGSRGRGLVGAAVGLLTGVVLLNAVLLPGYTWLHDMVFVPDLPFSGRTLGTDGSIPRAVPTDAVVALLTRILPGDVVQALLLLLVFVVVGAGSGRLARTTPGAVAAALAAGWNPYVVERLVIGHWSFLLGYATLPWIHAAAVRTVRRQPRAVVELVGWLALASLSGSTAAAIAGITAIASLGFTVTDVPALALRVRTIGMVPLVLAVQGAGWILPSIGRTGGLAVDPSGVEAFRSRAESALGVVPSVLTLGGVWHEPSVPGSRTSSVVVLAALLVVVVLLAICVRGGMGRELRPLVVAALVGLVIALAAAVPGGRQLVEHVITTVPGLGLLRDAQKFVAPLAVLLSVAAGRAIDLLMRTKDGRSSRGHRSRVVCAAALLIAPVATLPDAPAAAGRSMGSVAIPDDIGRVRDRLDAARDGGVAVFPWTQYRRFAWNDDKISLDPWNRLLDRYVLVNDDLPLSSPVVSGEDPEAAQVQAALDDPTVDLRDVLGRQGVRWALVLTDQRGAAAVEQRLGRGPSDVTIGDVRIVDLGPPGEAAPMSTSRLPIIVTGASTSLALLLWGAVAVRRRRADAGSSSASSLG